MKRIYLSGKDANGRYTILDDDDYYRIMEDDVNWYFSRGHADGTVDKKHTVLHRRIIGEENIPPGMEIDHISNDYLDNRRENLRICTAVQNQYNKIGNGQKDPNSFSYSPFKGVKRIGKQRYSGAISIREDGIKHTYMKYFGNELDAALYYNKMAEELYGEYARINTVPVPGSVGVVEFERELNKRLNGGK